MPIISIFLGIIIRLYHADHNPAHIHIQYGEYEAIMNIRNGKIIDAKVPMRVSRTCE